MRPMAELGDGASRLETEEVVTLGGGEEACLVVLGSQASAFPICYWKRQNGLM